MFHLTTLRTWLSLPCASFVAGPGAQNARPPDYYDLVMRIIHADNEEGAHVARRVR
jgi:hypothetical protein